MQDLKKQDLKNRVLLDELKEEGIIFLYYGQRCLVNYSDFPELKNKPANELSFYKVSSAGCIEFENFDVQITKEEILKGKLD